jgi:hypothetical protein
MSRPTLNSTLSTEEFLRWYWLKSELLQFCRKASLQTTGSKPELTARIAIFLAGETPERSVELRRNAVMPSGFSLNTIIEEGWRCSPALGAFFRKEAGKGFRFNLATRNFIHTKAGYTLEDAVNCYKHSVQPGATKQPIIPQNQYNQHTRDYYQANPKATRTEVINAWKSRRRSGAV